MPVSYIITPKILSKFKEPFGTLIQGSASETMKQLRSIIENDKPPKIFSVGDMVSRNLHDYSIIPQVSIFDNQTKREKLTPRTFPDKEIMQVKNPHGKITQEAIDAIQKAIQSTTQTQIVIDGEEDLLTLIAVMYAPENALIVYGQPNEGIVVVKVTAEKKAEAQKIWKKMKTIKE
jgi:uncharacterized protein (UPF0218 family)